MSALTAVTLDAFEGVENNYELLLAIRNTKISSLPDGFHKLFKNIVHFSLNIRDNQIQSIPPEILYGNTTHWEHTGTKALQGEANAGAGQEQEQTQQSKLTQINMDFFTQVNNFLRTLNIICMLIQGFASCHGLGPKLHRVSTFKAKLSKLTLRKLLYIIFYHWSYNISP